MKVLTRRASRFVAGMAGAAVLLGIGYVATTWYRYGRAAADGRPDPLVDRFIPAYEVRERHEIRVAAPAAETWAAAREIDLERSPVMGAIFRGRELLLGSERTKSAGPHPLVPWALSMGWSLLAEDAGREVVMGAVTRPWEANVRFQGLPSSEFEAFDAPGYVKIVWTLSVEPIGPAESIARTETRVATTDAQSRARMRRYWSWSSVGIRLIRRQALAVVRADAERRYHAHAVVRAQD